MTVGEMVKKIYDNMFSSSTTAQFLATITGKGTINIANVTSKYPSLTVSNFLIDITSGPDTYTGDYYNGGNNYGRVSGFTVSKSYDAKSGILTISGLSQTVYLWDKGGWGRESGIQNMTANVYMV